MSELKPCPFCGDLPAIYKKQYLDETLEEMFYIECTSCEKAHITEGWFSKENAIDAWNIRNPLVLYLKPNGVILTRTPQEPNSEGWLYTFVEQKNGDFVQITKRPPFVVDMGIKKE